MPWPDDREMAMVESGQLCFSETLDNGDNGGVDEAEWEIPVTVEELADTAIVLHPDIDDPQPTSVDVGKEGEKRIWMEPLPCKPVQLDENRRRDDHLFVDGLQEACTLVMVLVRAIHGRVKGAGIAD